MQYWGLNETQIDFKQTNAIIFVVDMSDEDSFSEIEEDIAYVS